jgi:small subunit ribosomal protein S6
MGEVKQSRSDSFALFHRENKFRPLIAGRYMNKTLETIISKQRDRSIVAKNTYETLLILDSNQYARDPGGVSKTIADLVEQAGGEVLVNRLWMEQKLAYPIDKHQKGTYWLTYFTMEGVGLSKLDRAFALCEPVLRQMTIKLEPRLVEPILANARGEKIVMSSHSDAEAKEEETAGV